MLWLEHNTLAWHQTSYIQHRMGMKYGLTWQIYVNSVGGVTREMNWHAEVVGSNHGIDLIFF